MNALPIQETDIIGLVSEGYTVTYERPEYGEGIENMIEFHNCIKEVVRNKDGIIDSPRDLPSVKYFDIPSKKIVGALWVKSGVLDRDNAPAAICDRTEETGAWGKHHIVLGVVEIRI